MIHYNRKSGFPPAKSIAAFALLLAAILAGPAHAIIQDAQFNLHISEDERRLAHMPLKPVLGVTRLFNLNSPFIELQNNAISDAPIVELRMTIGDEMFHFNNKFDDEYVMLGTMASSVPAGLQLDASVANDGNELIVNFLNGGLLPGQLVRFKFDIDVDAGAPFEAPAPEYYTVLFDLDGVQQYGTSPPGMSTVDNGRITVKYEMEGMPPLTLGPFAFEDQPGGMMSQYLGGRNFPTYRETPSLVGMFSIGPPQVIPEPGSVCLALLALAGAAGLRRRPRAEAGLRTDRRQLLGASHS